MTLLLAACMAIHTRGSFWYLVGADTSAYCQPKSTACRR